MLHEADEDAAVTQCFAKNGVFLWTTATCCITFTKESVGHSSEEQAVGTRGMNEDRCPSRMCASSCV